MPEARGSQLSNYLNDRWVQVTAKDFDSQLWRWFIENSVPRNKVGGWLARIPRPLSEEIEVG